ncbi:endonuclease/exonuclease/phosphatase family protein [Flavobacterium sp. J49]|uniref:endonuclease/exonuclease/phosphatase family protein n=1 Tax=Flavobacterium sp. J49 TaxID=2718534 RepID=UPI0015948F94|nr:endonuclease/exonuclease/phosphatase family protein [Flavobacterium sp. J49]MBF6642146.1 endonuclease/exonuclease/phosphatase family protein [Flavobacterium sp. J49]NIC03393.1 endonuclease/exonuclease/phosphatase family protein [Flavobacterium sp. J49]
MIIKKSLILLFLFLTATLTAQPKILTWNVENLGQSKSDSVINYIANTVKGYDIIALQEVVAGYGGAQAVAKLADELNRKGAKWDYAISDPTSSSAYKTERYAFLWKTAKVRLVNKPWLEKKFSLLIDREPYYATFEYHKKQFTLANFHAITKSKQPETEIKHFKNLPAQYPSLNIVFVGDFNCPQTHTVFNPLKKMGYKPAFENQKTSLKKRCDDNNCLSNEFDNIWYNSNKFLVKNAKAILFYQDFTDFNSAREVSDHIPLAIELELK